MKVETLALRRIAEQAKLWPVKTPIFYHNPRCSKSRAVHEILAAASVEFEEIRYLESPPSLEDLRSILARLDGSVEDMIRSKEAPYNEMGLADADGDVDRLLAAIVEAPVLLERPLVVWPDRAVIGRPPERISAVLSDLEKGADA